MNLPTQAGQLPWSIQKTLLPLAIQAQIQHAGGYTIWKNECLLENLKHNQPVERRRYMDAIRFAKRTNYHKRAA